ncbi:hypothetical protein EG68_00576 [Paragonimus skrjabini miyazakii]|uniref:Diacylglycerol kinase n=1 Tax=Paragonimus skrjabini miyazakii TaxID=59628 RepID=A0A8S9ZCL6_9TREM|nr:hypothetical protein EG68_00576 [Paragonimus skrjabini miyazakii]
MPYELRATRKHSDVTPNTHSNTDSVSQSRISLVNNVSVPDWSVESKLGDHLWWDTTGSGDVCQLSELDCCKSGAKKKCSVCRIAVHVRCMDNLQVACRLSYREADIRDYRDQCKQQQRTPHHWVNRRRQENKCKRCLKSIQPKFSFSSKETVAIQCTWCKASYHNKPNCLPEDLIHGHCDMGAHAGFIVPAEWIIKMPLKNTFKSSVRRTSSLVYSTPEINSLETNRISTSVSRPEQLTAFCAGDSNSLRIQCRKDEISGGQSPCKRSTNLKLAPGLPFVIKANPVDAVMRKPLLVFINPKSGGNQGLSLLRKFQWMLNPRQVFDLSQGGPRMGLELFNRVPNLRVLVCGGDGTVGWVFSTIDELGLSPPPPVAVLPLGTGNDLARTLHWGSGYTDEPKSKILRSVANGEIIALDRWHVVCEQRTDLLDGASSVVMTDDEDGRPVGLVRNTLPLTVFNNYFSLGADAATALEFHECREANPEKFTSRLKNKMFYAGCGGKDLLRRCWRDLSEHITLMCDGKDMTPLINSLRPHVILFLNIPKYGSGTLPWGHAPATAGFKPPRVDDGLLEVIGLSSTTLALLQVGGHGDRICQCREVILTTDKVIPVQIDGEPCRLLPAKIEIRCSHQALVVKKRGRRSSSLSRNNSKDFLEKRGTCGQAWLHIFVISLRDYEAIAEDALVLRHLAAYYGSISVTFEATVSIMRRTIETFNDSFDPVAATESQQHQKKRSGRSERPLFRLSNSWLFVDSTTAASRFFRIDSMRESVHFITDICNMEELFLIDNQMEPRLVQRKSTEDQVTTKTESHAMNESIVIDSCKNKQAEQTGDKLNSIYGGNSIFSSGPHLLHISKTTEKKCGEVGSGSSTIPQQIITTTSEQKPNRTANQSLCDMEPVNKDTVPCEKTRQVKVTDMQLITVGSLNSMHTQPVMSQPVKQAINEATESSSLNLWKGSLDDTYLTRSRRRLSLKEDEEQSCAVREWLNLEMRQLSYSSSRSGQTSVIDLTGSDTEDANRQTECAQRFSVCSMPVDYEDDAASFQARLNKALLNASRDGNAHQINKLLEAGANLLAVDERGRSALHLAVKFGCEDAVSALLKRASPELLELREYKKGQTALHKAAASGRQKICQLLVQAGACPAVRDANGKRPKRLACDVNDRQLAHYLQREELLFLISHGSDRVTV